MLPRSRQTLFFSAPLFPEIRRLADEPFQFNLAVSLHGATDEVRGKMPEIYVSLKPGFAPSDDIRRRVVEAIEFMPDAGAFVAMGVFLLLLVEGLVWAWQKGVLTWK